MIKRFVTVMLCLLLSACGQQYIVNEISLVQTLGFDRAGSDVKGTVLIADYKQKGTVGALLSETITKSESNIMPSLNSTSKNPIEYGQLRMVLLGKDFSQKGISTVLSDLCRDPKISLRLHFGVSDRTAAEMLKAVKDSDDTNILSDSIKHNISDGNLPRSNLQTTLFDFYQEGKDLFLPYLTMKNKEIKVDGLALFRNENYIFSVDMNDSLLLKMLIENAKNGTYLVPTEEENSTHRDYSLLKIVSSKTNYTLNHLKPLPSVSIHIKVQAQIKNLPHSIDMNSGKQMLTFQRKTELYIEKNLRKFLSECKKNKVDPLGLGNFVIRNSRGWNSQSFDEVYTKMDTPVNVSLTIVNSGYSQ